MGPAYSNAVKGPLPRKRAHVIYTDVYNDNLPDSCHGGHWRPQRGAAQSFGTKAPGEMCLGAT
jgi:hypothetical protein